MRSIGGRLLFTWLIAVCSFILLSFFPLQIIDFGLATKIKPDEALTRHVGGFIVF